MMNISSRGLLDRAKEAIALAISASLGPMLRLLSTINPTLTGVSSRWNTLMRCSWPFSYTRKFWMPSPERKFPSLSVTRTGNTTSSVLTAIADEEGGAGADCEKQETLPIQDQHTTRRIVQAHELRNGLGL